MKGWMLFPIGLKICQWRWWCGGCLEIYSRIRQFDKWKWIRLPKWFKSQLGSSFPITTAIKDRDVRNPFNFDSMFPIINLRSNGSRTDAEYFSKFWSICNWSYTWSMVNWNWKSRSTTFPSTDSPRRQRLSSSTPTTQLNWIHWSQRKGEARLGQTK